MKRIPLTQGKAAIVDNEDFEELNKYKWSCTHTCGLNYAVRGNPDSKPRHLRMHREILNTPVDMDTDHINGNGLDNRKSNLRICTHTENMLNCKPRGGTSPYIGIGWSVCHKKWHARIRSKGKQVHLGFFKDESKAARAFDTAAIKLRGEFARLNFPGRE